MKDKAIHDAMVSIENRVRHVYNQGYADGLAYALEKIKECERPQEDSISKQYARAAELLDIGIKTGIYRIDTGKHCDNCKHFLTDFEEPPCDTCLMMKSDGVSVNWQPKEGASE